METWDQELEQTPFPFFIQQFPAEQKIPEKSIPDNKTRNRGNGRKLGAAGKWKTKMIERSSSVRGSEAIVNNHFRQVHCVIIAGFRPIYHSPSLNV